MRSRPSRVHFCTAGRIALVEAQLFKIVASSKHCEHKDPDSMSTSLCSMMQRTAISAPRSTIRVATMHASATSNAEAQSASTTESPSESSTTWTPTSQRTGVLARKKGMTAIYDEEGKRIPVTVLHLDNVQVTLVKENEMIGKGRRAVPTHSVQVACSDRRAKTTSKAMLGHFDRAGTEPKYKSAEFKVSKEALIPVGATLSANHFIKGQYVDVTATSTGKGFQGVMKRHGFGGLPASHGVSISHRSHGSTGQNQDPGRVFKGKKMAGRMGGTQVTVQNLQVVKIDPTLNCIFVRGAVPGVDDAFVRVRDAIKLRKRANALQAAFGGTPPPFPAALS